MTGQTGIRFGEVDVAAAAVEPYSTLAASACRACHRQVAALVTGQEPEPLPEAETDER
jgi:hypothetical protein